MTAELVTFTHSETALVLDEHLSFDEWADIGKQLKRCESGVNWWIGDWLNYGERRYGEMYSQAIEETGLDYSSLRDAKWVSSTFELSRRRDNVSWSHHREIASLPPAEQDSWLDRAEAEQLSKSQLRTLLKTEVKAKAMLADTGYVQPKVWLASWEDWLPTQPDCDLLLTDPPYMTDVPDIAQFANEWLPVALAKVKPTGIAYVCIGAYPEEIQAYLEADFSGMKLEQILCWSYRNTIVPSPVTRFKANWQAILYFRGAQAPPLNWPVDSEGRPQPILNEQWSVQDIAAPDGRHANRFHEWQKPDELSDRFVRLSSKPGDLVLDPFCGTGTFLLSAGRQGRIGLGCDINEEHLRIAEERGCEVTP